MTGKEFAMLVDQQLDLCKEILVLKAKEYATSDRLHNFKIASALQKQTPRQALGGMMAKHTVSIYDMCRTDQDYSPEMWSEKITDHINYLLLLKAVVIDEMRAKQNEESFEITTQGCSKPQRARIVGLDEITNKG